MSSIFKLAVGILVGAMMLNLVGCGGGGGSSGGGTSEIVATNTNVYPTSKILPTTATSTTTFLLSGSDTSGGSWSGSMQMHGEGSTVFEGQSVTKVSQAVTLTLAGAGTSSSTISSYYKTDGILYKSIYSGSVSGTAVQTNNAIMPATFKVGDFAAGPSLSLNLNGSVDSLTTTYQVFDVGNGNARVVSTVTYQVANYSATSEYIIAPSGDMLSIKMILYYPAQNKTVTLNGTRL